ncbi:uncharacterized protein LOC132197148 [Neocloeon triangulifer]|uniref:uncharacterized protein LOC132197148 n=1 Tax=Neocloeon triangulifer TaxID=2078957 RepID=UPI00286F42FD|nr:uncharacterized protein LOC132197148 [Neocloeon triangulifer]
MQGSRSIVLAFFSFFLINTIARRENICKGAEVEISSDFISEIAPPNCTLARAAKLTQLANGKKYFFSDYDYNHENWNVANETCANMGLHLATVRNQADLNALRAGTKQRRTFNRKNWWLSAKNYGGGREKYNIRWHDGSELEQNSPLWSAGARKKDCVVFQTDSNILMSGYHCSSYHYFICELPTECY